MGASKPSRRSTPASVAPPAEARSGGAGRARRTWLVAGGLLVALALAVPLLRRGSGSRGEVPDPATEEMLAPVRRALAEARAAVLATPDSAVAWGQFAEVCDAHHLYAEAERAYREARRLDPREFRWTYGLAVVRDYQGAEAEELAGLFAAAIQLEPRYPPARLRCGDALVRQGRLGEARAAYEEAIALDPTFAMAHRNLGQTLLALEEIPLALESLERAAALDPGDGVVASSLSQAYWLAGDEARATRASEDAQRKAPVFGVPDPVRFAVDARNVSPLSCDRRASEHEQHGDWKAALPELERLAEMSPEDPGPHWRLGRALHALGQDERARQALEEALRLRPEHVGALAELAALAEEGGEMERAVELHRELCRLAPANAHHWKRLGGCLGQLGDLGGALGAFERALPGAGADAELLHNYGTALARVGRQREACERLRAALALEPDNAGTHLCLAASLATLGQRAEAIEHYERARALDPSLPTEEPLAALRAGL